jgi:hypothetical protein
MKISANGTFSNNFSIGDGLSSNKYIYANTNATNKPGIRYSVADGYFQKSDDGTIWQKIIGTNDLANTTIRYVVGITNSYETASTAFTNPINTVTQYNVYNSIRRADGYAYISNTNFGITSLNNVYRFVGYPDSILSLTDDTLVFAEDDSTDNYNSIKYTLDGYYGTLSFEYRSTTGAVCTSIVVTSNSQYVVQANVVNTSYKTADWWNGKACSEWYLTKARISESIAAGGGPGQVCSYVPGITAVLSAYVGGVLASNNRIYLIPVEQAIQANWHYIDANTGIGAAYAHGITAVVSAYIGGVLAPNDRIYMIPRMQSNQANWHYINTKTGVATAYAHGATVAASAYYGGVLSSNNKIYMAPFGQATQANWHYINATTGVVTAYSNNSGVTPVNNAYVGAVLSPSGRIYFIPFAQCTQSNWHYIDTNGSVVAYPNNSGVTPVSTGYFGASLSPDGKIYLNPYAQSNQAQWHYIDTNTNTVVAYTNNSGVTPVANAYAGSVYAPNGKIYFIPETCANQTQWHYIDTITGNVVAYTHGVTALVSAYLGGILAPNGRIYMVPQTQADQTTWHYIDTQCNLPLNKNICTNPMFNKF